MLRNVNEFTWEELGTIPAEDILAVLPVSSLEQHGRHLPVGADDFILTAVMKEVYRHEEIPGTALCLPTLHYGNSHEHLAFPGTVSLGCRTLVAVVEDVLAALKTHGVKKLCVINSHGGNTALLEAYAQEWEVKYGIKVYTVSFWSGWFMGDCPVAHETPLDLEIHAGELETSILLADRPETVKMARISTELDKPVTLKPYYQGWLTKDVTAGNGAMGCASKASAEKGRALIRFMGAKIAGILVDIFKGN